ncbi:DUF6400 family protein [Peterkaempfera sp. SMS 1(5)a]|uniref:DUF6400 family protein n=1 Tax=Peterkaempfera podocarpi TaxID=3232308 RepID=UPI003670F328
MADRKTPDLRTFETDLTAQEAQRRAAVLEAIGPNWDPVAVMQAEEQAYRMLYSDLDEDQQRIYDELVAAGVLPAHPGGGDVSA